MFILSVYCQSDVARGEGNPQITVEVHETREKAERALVDMYNELWVGDDNGQLTLSTFAEVAPLFNGRELPESPRFEIQQVAFGTRVQLDHEGRGFNLEGEPRVVSVELRAKAWDALHEQAQGMDSDSLCEYYADNEIDKYDEQGMKQLTGETDAKI